MSQFALSRARALIGTRARLQGRDSAAALDCIGLIIAAFDLPKQAFAADYALRNHSLANVDEQMLPFFRRVTRPTSRPGDVSVMRVAAGRLHLGMLSNEGLIHADLRLGRVVCRPGPCEHEIVRVFRRRIRSR